MVFNGGEWAEQDFTGWRLRLLSSTFRACTHGHGARICAKDIALLKKSQPVLAFPWTDLRW